MGKLMLVIAVPFLVACSSNDPPRQPRDVSRVEPQRSQFQVARSDDAKRTERVAADADNTARNARDRDGSTLTPFDQSEKREDLEVTQKIRKSLVKDDTLSTAAKNVKVITVDGEVTLRGPVKSEKERDKIVANAKRIAGSNRVDDQLEVEAKK